MKKRNGKTKKQASGEEKRRNQNSSLHFAVFSGALRVKPNAVSFHTEAPKHGGKTDKPTRRDRPRRRDTAPRSADRWTITRRSMKPAERAPCFPFSLMSGGFVLPATIRSFTAAPPPCSRLCRTPITHQQPASACVSLQVRVSGVGFQNKGGLQRIGTQR